MMTLAPDEWANLARAKPIPVSLVVSNRSIMDDCRFHSLLYMYSVYAYQTPRQ